MTPDAPDLIERQHEAGGTRSRAVYSSCETYRYLLERAWDPAARRITFVMLNPSTASELRNDPTIERCERRSRAMGFGAFRIVNLFAFRATAPADLRRASAPEGPANGMVIDAAVQWSDMTLAAWGTHGDFRGQGPRTAEHLRAAGGELYHLGLTKHGHPRHPLYVSYHVTPQRWID